MTLVKPRFSAARSRLALATARVATASPVSPAYRSYSSWPTAPRDQALGALVVALQSVHAGLELRHGALGLVQHGLVGARVDLEEHVPLLDQRPFLEVDLVQVARDAGPHLDGIDRGRPGGEVRVVRDLALDGITDRDRPRCCRGRFRGRPGTARHGQADSENQRNELVRECAETLPLSVNRSTVRPFNFVPHGKYIGLDKSGQGG